MGNPIWTPKEMNFPLPQEAYQYYLLVSEGSKLDTSCTDGAGSE